VYRYYLRWVKKGLFKRLLHHTAKQFNQSCFKIIDGSHVKVHQDACYKCQNIENQYFGKTKGDRNTKIHAMTNGGGKSLDFRLMPDHQQEITNALELLGNLKNTIVLTDKGYDSNELRLSVREMGGIALIPKEEVLGDSRTSKNGVKPVIANEDGESKSLSCLPWTVGALVLLLGSFVYWRMGKGRV